MYLNKYNRKEIKQIKTSKLLRGALVLVPLLGVVLLVFSFFFRQNVEITAAALKGKLTNIESLGSINHYNGVIFGNYSSKDADMEGALAVGGTSAVFGITDPRFCIGTAYWSPVVLGEYKNTKGYPTLLLGTDKLNLGADIGSAGRKGTYNINGGKLAMSESLYDNVYTSLNTGFVGDQGYLGEYTVDDSVAEEWFKVQWDLVQNASAQYLNANSKTVKMSAINDKSYMANGPAQYKNENLGSHLRGGASDRILVINVDTENKTEIGFGWWPHNNIMYIDATWMQQYDLVIFNYPGVTKVTYEAETQFTGSGDNNPFAYSNTARNSLSTNRNYVRDSICQKMITHFPDAEEITLKNVYFWGSLFAPNATINATNGGSINGQLIAQNLNQGGGFELHAFEIDEVAYEVVEVEEENTADVEVEKKLYFGKPYELLLEGAEFDLYKVANGVETKVQLEQSIVTDQYGKFVIKDLPEGTYRLKETKAPEYGVINNSEPSNEATYYVYEFVVPDENEDWTALNDDPYYEIDNEGNIKITRYNSPEVYNFELYKIDSETGQRLPGAKFYLERQGDQFYHTYRVLDNIESDANGVISLSGLPIGTYRLVETDAPDNYMLMDEITFTIDGNGTLTLPDGIQENEIPNERGEKKYVVKIIKYEENNGTVEVGKEQLLSDAEFKLYQKNNSGQYEEYKDADGYPLMIKTGNSGSAILYDLPEGDYRLVETVPPKGGYIAANPEYEEGFGDYCKDFTLGEVEEGDALNSDLPDLADAYFEIKIPNEKLTASATLQKICEETGEPLAGVKFSLYNTTNGYQLLKAGATDENGIINVIGLEEGTYELVETEVPAGYKQGDNIRFRVDISDQGEIIIGLLEANDKVDFEKIPAEEASRFDYRVTVKNEPYLASLRVYKRAKDTFQSGLDDDDDMRIFIEYLAGAEFQLQRYDDSTGEYVNFGDTFISERRESETDNQGNQVATADFMNRLPIGSYQIIEVTCPAGYETMSDSNIVGNFIVDKNTAENELTISYTVINRKNAARSDLKIKKVDRETGEGLARTQFKLWRIDEGTDGWTSKIKVQEVLENFDKLEFVKFSNGSNFTTDENGWLNLNDMEPGVYALYESEPPEGYMYVLEPHTTRPPSGVEDMDFYYHLTAFEVVPVNESDMAKGVRVKWVHDEKIKTDEARFNNSIHETDSWDISQFGITEEAQYESDDAYRAFTITNRKLILPELNFKKVDGETGELLKGAEFKLYAGDNYEELVGTYTSDENGNVNIKLSDDVLDGYGRNNDSDENDKYESQAKYSNHTIGKFKLIETVSPEGYANLSESYYFELVIDPLTKAVAMYELDEYGQRAGQYYFYGYTAPETGEKRGTYSYEILLPDVLNNMQRGSFTIKKELQEKSKADEDFMFRIIYKSGNNEEVFYGTVTVAADSLSSSITFTNLRYGTYVVEEMPTNWRYELAEGEVEQQDFELKSSTDGNTITFINTKENDQWLSDKDKVINKMTELD